MNNLTYKWLTGILITIVLAMTAFVINILYSDVSEIKIEHTTGTQRIQSLETSRDLTKDRLDRLEDKIDWLIKTQGGIPEQIINKIPR